MYKRQELKESKAEVEAFGTKVEAIAADLTVEGLVMDTVDTVVRKFGTVDILMTVSYTHLHSGSWNGLP